MHSCNILRVFVQTDSFFRPCAAGILGGSPCSPELVKEVSSLLGIEEVLVSESYTHKLHITVLISFIADSWLKIVLWNDLIMQFSFQTLEGALIPKNKNRFVQSKGISLDQKQAFVKDLLDFTTPISPHNVTIVNIDKWRQLHHWWAGNGSVFSPSFKWGETITLSRICY